MAAGTTKPHCSRSSQKSEATVLEELVATTMEFAVKYDDGTVAHVGDRVRISNGDRGVVIAFMDTDEYSPEATKSNWEQERPGILVRTDAGALVQFQDPLPPGLLWRDQDSDPREV